MSLSCGACRHRKVKCDKAVVCGPCVKASLCCVYPERRQRASTKEKKRKHEASHDGVAVADHIAADGSTLQPSTHDQQANLNGHYASFVQKQENATSINRVFWDQLDEYAASDPDASFEERPLRTTRPAFDQSKSPSAILFGPRTQQEHLPDISEEERSILVPIFFSRIHPICRILHEPTALAFFQQSKELTHAKTKQLKFDSLRAVDCAIAFAAVKTMTRDECISKLGTEKQSVEVRFQLLLESALAACNITESRELVTLQALTLYIVSIAGGHVNEPLSDQCSCSCARPSPRNRAGRCSL